MKEHCFRIGDKVIAISESFGWGDVDKGDIGVIANISKYEIKVDFSGQTGWSAYSSNLKLCRTEVKLPEELFTI